MVPSGARWSGTLALTLEKMPAAGEVLSRLLDLDRVVLLTRMHRQAAVEIAAVGIDQAADGDGAEIDPRPRIDVVGDVERLRRRRLQHVGCRDLGQRVATVAQGVQQVALPRQHGRGQRRVAGLDAQPVAELIARGLWEGAVDLHTAQVEQRPPVDRDGDLGDAAGGQGAEHIRQRRIVERAALDGDAGVAVIVAEAVQRLREPAGIALRPRHQRERPHRGRWSAASRGWRCFSGRRRCRRPRSARWSRCRAADRPPAPPVATTWRRQPGPGGGEGLGCAALASM